jgi:hypothetical protein
MALIQRLPMPPHPGDPARWLALHQRKNRQQRLQQREIAFSFLPLLQRLSGDLRVERPGRAGVLDVAAACTLVGHAGRFAAVDQGTVLLQCVTLSIRPVRGHDRKTVFLDRLAGCSRHFLPCLIAYTVLALPLTCLSIRAKSQFSSSQNLLAVRKALSGYLKWGKGKQ